MPFLDTFSNAKEETTLEAENIKILHCLQTFLAKVFELFMQNFSLFY